jgi:hypothetical protein
MTKKAWGTKLACGCSLGYERCVNCRPGLDMDQEKACAMSVEAAKRRDGEKEASR